MAIINVAHYDDSQEDLNDIEIQFIAHNRELKKSNIDVELNQIQFLDTSLLIKKLKEGIKYDYLILDLFDDETKENKGEKVLKVIKSLEIDLPTYILTFGNNAINQVNYKEILEKYKFILESPIIKKSEEDDLISEKITDHLQQKEPFHNYFETYDPDDVFLNVEIKSIGKNNLNNIIRKIKTKKGITTSVFLERMSSGFSGASVFKLVYNNEISILKVSNDRASLKDEMDRAKKYFKKFPTRFRISISSETEYSANGTSAYLIENVKDGETLFDWLKNNPKKEYIENFLEDLFLQGDCLSERYKDNRVNEKKYSFINEKFQENELKNYARVKKVIESELKYLIKEYSLAVSCDELLNFIEDNKFLKINPKHIKKTNYTTVCHGDLHSKNIMIQSNKNPFIIDTGGMKEDYYCMDICRLLSNLFIEGFDINNKKFFDINEISSQFNISKNIIYLNPISPDGTNDGFIIAINWITDKIEHIYGDIFNKWEFQLGLLKEFLQISYRSSIPPNKRVLAILIASECLSSANKHFIK